MANIAAQAATLAVVLSSATGMRVWTERPTLVRAGDGWVNVAKVAPSAFSAATCDATFTGVLILGSDERQAALRVAELSVPVINAVTQGSLHPDGVSLEPALLPVGDVSAGEMYALITTLTLEVD